MAEIVLELSTQRVCIQQLTQQGLRKHKFLQPYVTYIVKSGSEGDQDFIENLSGRGNLLEVVSEFSSESQRKNKHLNRTDGLLIKP